MKKAEFDFVWLFAIIAGVAILVLAIYGASRIGDTSRFQSDTEVGKKIAIITDPLQAGFAEGSFGKITFQSETRVNNKCLSEEFGKNEISVSTRSGVGEEWKPAGGATSVHNKYIFSTPQNSGKEYYVFSKPFYFPYKVADLIFMTSKDYCFVNPPAEVENEILGLNIPNIKIENCTNSEEEVRVCFGSASGCGSEDVTVYGACMSNCGDLGGYDFGRVVGNGKEMGYVGNLMYAAIFSSSEIYDCNVRRLMYRTAKISEVLIDKADLMNSRGCNTNLVSDLYLLGGLTMNATSKDLISTKVFANQVEVRNERELCGLW